MTHARFKAWLSRDRVVEGGGAAGSRAGEDAAHDISLSITPVHGDALALPRHPGILWVTSTDPTPHIHPRVSYQNRDFSWGLKHLQPAQATLASLPSSARAGLSGSQAKLLSRMRVLEVDQKLSPVSAWRS